MDIELRIVCSGDADLAALSRMLNAVAGTGLPYSLTAPPAPAVAAPPVVAPPHPTALREPPVVTSPELEQKIQQAEAKVAEKPAKEVEVKRSPGKQKRGAASEPPVPRPEGGKYGEQVCPEGVDKAAYTAERKEAKLRLRAVMQVFQVKKVEHVRFFEDLIARYGDGDRLSTVPNGNLAALVAEAEAGTKDLKPTKGELEEAKAAVLRQDAQAEREPAGASS